MAEEKQYTIEELENKLTEKERMFCHQWIIDWNGARAARKAGYSEETAREIASQNLTKSHIKQYIAFIRNNLEEEAGISKLRQLNELVKIAYSSISQIHDSWIELSDWNEIKKNNPSAMATIESIDTKIEKRTVKDDFDRDCDVEIHFVKIKLYPKIQAIQEINKMMGYNAPDRLITADTSLEDLLTQD